MYCVCESLEEEKLDLYGRNETPRAQQKRMRAQMDEDLESHCVPVREAMELVIDPASPSALMTMYEAVWPSAHSNCPLTSSSCSRRERAVRGIQVLVRTSCLDTVIKLIVVSV